MQMTWVRVALFVLITFACAPREAAASCASFKPRMAACDWLAQSPVVFRGRVVDIDRRALPVGPDTYRHVVTTRIDVVEKLAGDPGATVVITGGDSSLDVHFVAGTEYIVFGRVVPGRGFSADACAGTVPSAEAPELLSQLRALRGVTGAGAVFTGTVEQHIATGDASDGRQTRRFEGVRVRARSDGHVGEAISRADGTFEITGLPLGEYRIDVDAPPGLYYPSSGFVAFEVHSLNGCVTRPATLRHDGRIAGRLVNSDGRALAGVPVNAVAPDRAGETVHADDTGAFEIAGLEPGRYVIAAAGAALFSPGVDRRDRAIGVDVPPGGRVELEHDVQVATTREPMALSGIVLDADGAPVRDAHVRATGGQGSTDEAVTDAAGRFRLVVLSAAAYTVTSVHWSTGVHEARVSVAHEHASRELTLVARSAQR